MGKLPQAPQRPGVIGGYAPIIVLFEALLANYPAGTLDAAVESALSTSAAPLVKFYGITDGKSFVEFANSFLRWVPEENRDGRAVYDVITVFYFILDRPPLKQYQTPISPSSVGKPLTPISAWLVSYANSIGQWMNSPDSLTDDSLQTFIDSEAYFASEWWPKETPGKWVSFNDFFARHLHDGVRPIASGDNVIVFPADSTFDVAYDIGGENDDTITVKGISWDISTLLVGSNYANEFHGGVWMHSFLNTFNYHRQHAPVGGTLLEARVIQGAAYVDVIATPDGGLKRSRRMAEPGGFPTPPPSIENKTDALDGSGYQFLQTRGLFIIDAGAIGLVAVLPIGMGQVDSVISSVKAPMKIEKGAEISKFQFGGSDIVCVFQQKAGLKAEDFANLPTDRWSKYGSPMVTANPQ